MQLYYLPHCCSRTRTIWLSEENLLNLLGEVPHLLCPLFSSCNFGVLYSFVFYKIWWSVSLNRNYCKFFFPMHLSRWLGGQFPTQFEQERGVLLFSFWKLFEKDLFADRGLLGNWIALNLAGMSVLFCCWIWCWFRIPSSILLANSGACRGSTVFLK